MKRLEEIFDTTISDYNKETSSFHRLTLTIGERKMFLEMIQDYAREVAQASLEKAAEEAKTKKVLGVTKRFSGSALVSRIIVGKESITNQSNIVML
ncbi:hypothetical protein BAX93_05425 [Elizabethkingia meningoseptica]|uniref:hypothetical protein n=1 Tax=Elizabethkingia meningoseptica TaxID=238 RepID=UPI00099ACBA8|nr:hypothetical protein [Elizabethkingia meningoseptica]OPC11942.1 hypothetical protein BAX93_05425 [Elizabethkingia meningoseptica]